MGGPRQFRVSVVSRGKTVGASRTTSTSGTWKRDVDSYLDLWAEEIRRARAVDRHEWDRYFQWLIDKRIAKPEDRREFDRHFTFTKRKKATPRPGIEVARCWPIDEAKGLARTGKFAREVGAAHDRIVELLGR
jgi:hypothetical protein